MRLRVVPAALLILQIFTAHGVWASSTSQFADLALDSSNRPRIVGYDESNFFVRLGLFTASSTWSCYTLQDAPSMGGASPISGRDGVAVVDAGGTPYVAYTVQKLLTVQHPESCGSVTQVDRVQIWLQKGTTVSASNQVCIDSTGSLFGCVNFSDEGIHVAMTRTSDGRVHAAYLNGTTALRYAVSNTSVTSFTSEAVTSATATNGGGDISIAIDSGGMPHIAFIQAGHYEYAIKSGTSWSSTALSVPAYSSGYVGRPLTNVSLRLDGSGFASILFTVGDSLWCARETSALTFATAEVVDGGSDMQGYPSLARASNGNLHASYFRNGAGQEVLYYSQRGSSGWGTPVAVASHVSPLGAFTNKRQTIQLTSGATQLPRIAYPTSNPDGGGAVWYAESNGTAWTTNLVVPCNVAPPPPDSGGGGGGHHGYEDGGATYNRPPEEATGEMFAVRSPSVLRGGTSFVLQIVTLRATSLKLEVLDVSGRLIDTRVVALNLGENDVRWNVGSVPAGIYLVRAAMRNGTQRTFRVAVLR